MHRDDVRLLEAGLRRLGLDVSNEQLDTLSRFLDELSMWNRRMNLVRGSGRDLVVKHVLDSVAPLATARSDPRIPELLDDGRATRRVLDAGSGAGFPGIPVAVIRPGWTVDLVERSAKRCAYLRSTTLTLGIPNVRVVESGVEELAGRGLQTAAGNTTESDAWDVVLCRALAQVSKAVPLLLPLLGPGGIIAYYAGRLAGIEDFAEEPAASAADAAQTEALVRRVEVPFLDVERNLLIIRARNTSR